MTSDSPALPTSASRLCVGPAVHTRQVCVPEITDESDVLAALEPCVPVIPGICGSPRLAVCTTVPDRPLQLRLLQVDEQLGGGPRGQA